MNLLASMKTCAVHALALAAMLTMLSGCASKGRVQMVEGSLMETQSEVQNLKASVQEGQQNLQRELAALSLKIDETAQNLKTLGEHLEAIEQARIEEKAEFEAIRDETKGYANMLGDYKADYDKTWQQINVIERDLGESVRQMQRTVEANRSAIDTLKSDVDTKHAAVNTKIDRAQTDMTTRLETTNQDLTTFRKQVADHFDSLKQSYVSLGKAVYEIVKLQYTQFQNVTEEYTKTMSQIEAQLPASTLGSFEPKESLAPESTE